MKLIAYLEQRTKNFQLIDFSVLKLYVMLIGLLLGAYFPQYVKQNLSLIIVLIILTFMWLMYKIFKSVPTKN